MFRYVFHGNSCVFHGRSTVAKVDVTVGHHAVFPAMCIQAVRFIGDGHRFRCVIKFLSVVAGEVQGIVQRLNRPEKSFVVMKFFANCHGLFCKDDGRVGVVEDIIFCNASQGPGFVGIDLLDSNPFLQRVKPGVLGMAS